MGGDQPDRAKKSVRNIRFSDAQWDKLAAAADREGVAQAEYLRRVVDEHFLRKEIDDRLIKRLTKLEQRIVGIEGRMARMEAGEDGS